MSRKMLKIMSWLLGLSLLFASGYVVVVQVDRLLHYFQSSADPATALNIVPNKPADLKVALEWLPDDLDTGREMEPLTRVQIESSYLRAWLQWNISYLRGEPYGLETYFVGPALATITKGVESAQLQGWSLEQTDLAHQLQLHFYSADGSIVSFTARDVLVAQVMRDETTQPIMAEVTRADYNVIMMLEDGNWRVRHWVRASGDIASNVPLAEPPSNDFVSTAGKSLMWQERPYTVRGINYYPQDTPWDAFWPAYDATVIDTDFALIESLGLNTVRIFVPFEPTLPEATDHDGSVINGDVDPYVDLRDKLADLLDRAEQYNLKVIVTLFDFRTDYQILLWPNTRFDATEIIPYFADSPTILAWDIKNEPDLDQPGNTTEMVNLWLEYMIWQVRQYDPNHLITIGWARAENAHQLADQVDFVSFHDYEPPQTFVDRAAALRSLVPGKPLLLTEFGLPTWNSRFYPNGHTELEQAVYYGDMRRMMEDETDVAGYMAWTLYDFVRVPVSVTGRWPWNRGPQRYLGLIDHVGNKKDAAFLLADDADLDVTRPFFLWRFTKPFWQTVYIGLGILFWIGRWLLRRFDSA